MSKDTKFNVPFELQHLPEEKSLKPQYLYLEQFPIKIEISENDDDDDADRGAVVLDIF